MSKRIKADLALIFITVIWGIAFVIGKVAISGAAPFAILFWRFLISCAICFAIFNKRILAAPRRTILCGAVLCFSAVLINVLDKKK